MLGLASCHAKGLCGNDRIEGGEECDDGNKASGDGCNSSCIVENECYDKGDTFSFFSFSDSYPRAKGGEGAFEQIITDIFRTQRHAVMPRFLVVNGDWPFFDASGHSTHESALMQRISGARYPFHCPSNNRDFPYFVALGNHDVDFSDNGVNPEQKIKYWSSVLGPKLNSVLLGIRNFRDGPSKGYDKRTTYSFDYKNSHFVIINQYHTDGTFGSNSPIACITPDIYRWVDEDLAGTKKKIKFVFGHTPAWSYCSKIHQPDQCTPEHPDYVESAHRPRPYSHTGQWQDAFGRHWYDSLGHRSCPQINGAQGRRVFWEMLSRHGVIAHFVGHTHTYSSRLVSASGITNNEASGYSKVDSTYDASNGTWEIDTGFAHEHLGNLYVLTTVSGNKVSFESYDRRGREEDFHRIESWSVETRE